MYYFGIIVQVKSSMPTEVQKPMDFNDYMSESDGSEDEFDSMCSDRYKSRLLFALTFRSSNGHFFRQS